MSHDYFGSESRLIPRFGFAPFPVSAESGVLNVKGLGRWFNGYFYRVTLFRARDYDCDAHRVTAFPVCA